MTFVRFDKLIGHKALRHAVDKLWRRPSLGTGCSVRLATEALEARCLLAADFDVGVRLETTDLAGSEIASVEVGQPFLLNAYVQDIRDVIDPPPGGIFSAYFDVEYNPIRASIDLKETQSALLEGFPTGGSFTLTFEGQTTASIPITATAVDVEAALRALSTLDADEVEVFQPSFDRWTVRFGGDWVNQNVPELVPDGGGLLGGTNSDVVVTQATGVNPTNILDVIASIHYGSNYPDRHRGSSNPVGTLDEVGAARFATGGLGPAQQLLFQVQFTADAAGTLDFTSNAADDIDNETLIVETGSVVSVDRIEFGTASIDVIEFGDTIATRFDMRVVLDPTTTDADGQVEVLPEGREWIHEWHRHWVEVWVSTPGSTSAGFTSAAINVDYDTTTFTATSVEPGAAFAGGLNSTINDTTGQVELTGNVTSAEVVGADQFVLLARIQMESTNADAGLPIGLGDSTSATSIFQPWIQFSGDGNAAAQLDSALADIEVSDPPSTGLHPMPYDLDDDGSIKFGDLAIFSSLFLKNVADTEAARKADFDLDGRVAFGDLALLSANFLKGQSDGNDIFMPLNFPTGFESSTAATASISTASGPPSETAASLAAASLVAEEPLLVTQFIASDSQLGSLLNEAQERDEWFSRLQPNSYNDEIATDRDDAFNLELLDALFAAIPARAAT